MERGWQTKCQSCYENYLQSKKVKIPKQHEMYYIDNKANVLTWNKKYLKVTYTNNNNFKLAMNHETMVQF